MRVFLALKGKFHAKTNTTMTGIIPSSGVDEPGSTVLQAQNGAIVAAAMIQ